MPATRECSAPSAGRLRIERLQNSGRSGKCIDPGLRHRGVRLFSGHGDLEMKAAVVRIHDGVGKPRRDHEVRPGETAIEQEFWPDFAAGLLIVSEMQLDGATELRTSTRRIFKRQQRKCIGREIGFRNRNAAPEHDRTVRPVGNLGPVRIMRPAEPGRHHSPWALSASVGPSPKRCRTIRFVALTMPQACARSRRHRMRLDRETEPFQQVSRARRVCRAIARRVVARHLHELGQKLRLARELAIDECGMICGIIMTPRQAAAGVERRRVRRYRHPRR